MSTQQGYNLASTFEFNYFDRTIYGASSGSVEPEAVSHKSSNNVYRYNTFREVRGQIALRHGDNCTVEGNFFFGAGLSNASGVRVIGQNHLVRNSYFQDVDGSGTTSALVVYRGDSNWPASDDGSGNEAAHNAKIFHNTFVNCNSRSTSAPAATPGIRPACRSATTSCRARAAIARCFSSATARRRSRSAATSSTTPAATTV